MGLALNLGICSREALIFIFMFPREPCGVDGAPQAALLAGRWPSADALAPRGVPSQGAGGLPGLPALRPTVPLSCLPILRGAWPCLSTPLGVYGGPGLVNRPLNWVRLPHSERIPGPEPLALT